MNRDPPHSFMEGLSPHLAGLGRLPVAMALAVGCLFAAGAASAAEAAVGQAQTKAIPPGQVFAFLFMMLGPLKIIGPFAKITQKADARLARQIAIRATLFSSLAVLVAGFLGEIILDKYGLSPAVLALSAGVILFLVALLSIIQQFTPPTAIVGEAAAPAPGVAMTPLAFPTIITPYGVAALIVFLALSADLQSRLVIGGIVMAIMLLNLVAMLMARPILRYLGIPLQILGAVLGVVQVALALKIIITALRTLSGA